MLDPNYRFSVFIQENMGTVCVECLLRVPKQSPLLRTKPFKRVKNTGSDLSSAGVLMERQCDLGKISVLLFKF